MSPPAGVAAFDFDGTLVRRDSFIGFLRHVAGPRAVNVAWSRAWRSLAGVGRSPHWRDAVKETLVRETLTGLPAHIVERAAVAYAESVAALITPDMRRLLDRHRDAGHRTVVVSASLEVYLVPAGRLIGIDSTLGTRLEIGDDGHLTGRLLGPNCRGPEKARRLSQWMTEQAIDPGHVPLWAYGDSRGDREMLAAAAFAARVRRGRLPRRYHAWPDGARAGALE